MSENEYIEGVIKNFKLTFTNKEQANSNKSTSYLLPMLGRVATDFRSAFFPSSQFRALFIGDKTHNLYQENKLLLLYKFSGKEEFIKFEEFLENIENYVGKYEPDKQHTMYVYDIPTKWLSDFNKFKDWKPSEFSEDYKKHIVNFYTLGKTHPLYQTIYKKEERFQELEDVLGIKIPRELEAGSSPYWEIEYYCDKFKVVNKIKDKAYDDEW